MNGSISRRTLTRAPRGPAPAACRAPAHVPSAIAASRRSTRCASRNRAPPDRRPSARTPQPAHRHRPGGHQRRRPTEIDAERVLPRRIGDGDGHAREDVGERLVRQTELPVARRHLLEREADVVSARAVHHRVGRSRGEMHDARGAARGERPAVVSASKYPGCGRPRSARCAAMPARPSASDRILEPAAGSDRLAEPVDAQPRGIDARQVRRLRRQRERVVDDRRVDAVPLAVRRRDRLARRGHEGGARASPRVPRAPRARRRAARPDRTSRRCESLRGPRRTASRSAAPLPRSPASAPVVPP